MPTITPTRSRLHTRIETEYRVFQKSLNDPRHGLGNGFPGGAYPFDLITLPSIGGILIALE